jgi:cell division protease FtsH
MGMREGGDYSEATAGMIDLEIRAILATEYGRSLDILKAKQDVLEKGAQLLLDKEKVDGEEIRALMA